MSDEAQQFDGLLFLLLDVARQCMEHTILRQLPPGTLPPLIVNYSASSVPILRASLGPR
jgi:hypothetical protein